MLTILILVSPTLINRLRIRPLESFFHWSISPVKVLDIRVATPPCFPIAGDQKLCPFHSEDSELITFSLATSVSCRSQISAV